jgi:diguanylate cyclase (GGDEF)-like protein
VARSAAFNADVAVIFEDAQAAAELLRLLVAQERLASIEIVLTDGRVLAREQRPAGWLGGDEFAILLAPLADAADADRVARKIEAQMHQPLQLDGLTPPVPPIVPRVSIGLAMYPADGADAQALLQHADRLMYERKRGQREAPAA